MTARKTAAIKRTRATTPPAEGLAGTRQTKTAATRHRIATAVRALLIEDGFGALTFAQIAERAGVARSTVYYEFDSKPKLLSVVLEEATERAGINWLETVLRHSDAVDTLQRTITLACRFWFSEYPLFQRMLALSAADPEVADVIATWNEDRLRAMQHLTDKLAKEGKLRPECSKREVLSVLVLSTSFETFQQLLSTNMAVPDRIASTLFSLCSSVIETGEAVLT